MASCVSPAASLVSCPLCGSSFRQAKHGKTMSGSQKYRCHGCQKVYNPHPQKQGCDQDTRHKALKMYVDGLGFRRIGRLLGVSHSSVVNWVNAYHATLPPVPEVPPNAAEQAKVEVIEMDELFSFVGTKKAASTW